MTDEKKYSLKYEWIPQFENKPYTKKDIQNEYQGLCDAMVVLSIVRPSDGGYSVVGLSLDGDTGEQLTDHELFKAWSILGMSLENKTNLRPWVKTVIDCHIDLMRKIMSRKP